MIDGVTYLKVDRVRGQLFNLRQRATEPQDIEVLTEAIDELDDMLVAIVRDDVKDDDAAKPVPRIPTPAEIGQQTVDNIVDLMLYAARGPFMDVVHG